MTLFDPKKLLLTEWNVTSRLNIFSDRACWSIEVSGQCFLQPNIQNCYLSLKPMFEANSFLKVCDILHRDGNWFSVF